MSDLKSNRWGATSISHSANKACAEIHLSYGQVGCRLIAIALNHLASVLGGIDCFPEEIVFRSADRPFAERALWTLKGLKDQSTRSSFMSLYSWQHVPALPGEHFSSYESRATDATASRFPEFMRLDRTLVHVGGSYGYPDGLLLSPSNELLIVEAKKRGKSFEEGTSQLLQYRVRALAIDRFRDAIVKPLLVTSTDKETTDYRLWLSLMQSDRNFKFIVDEAGKLIEP